MNYTRAPPGIVAQSTARPMTRRAIIGAQNDFHYQTILQRRIRRKGMQSGSSSCGALRRVVYECPTGRLYRNRLPDCSDSRQAGQEMRTKESINARNHRARTNRAHTNAVGANSYAEIGSKAAHWTNRTRIRKIKANRKIHFSQSYATSATAIPYRQDNSRGLRHCFFWRLIASRQIIHCD